MLFAKHAQKDPAPPIIMFLGKDGFEFHKGASRQPDRFPRAKAICAQLYMSGLILAGSQASNDGVRHQCRMKVSRRQRTHAWGTLHVTKADKTSSRAHEKVVRKKGPEYEHLFPRVGDHPLETGAIDLKAAAQ